MSTTQTSSTRRGRRAFRPALEAMEYRITPAISSGFNGGVLTVAGDAAADQVRISASGDDITVIAGASTKTFENVTQLKVNLGGGNDTFSLDLSGGTFAENLKVAVNAGAGNDRGQVVLGTVGVNLSVDLNVGNDFLGLSAQAMTSPSATRALNVQGNVGNDRVVLNFGALASAGSVDVTAGLGAGNDYLYQIGGAAALGATFTERIDAGAGNDFVRVDASATATLGALALGVNLGDGNDVFIYAQGVTRAGATLAVTVTAGAGHDTVVTNLSATVSGAATLAANLGVGNDVFLAVGGAVAAGGSQSMTADAGAGNDRVFFRLADQVAGRLDAQVMLGVGHDLAELTGGATASGGQATVTFDAGGGNDVVRIDVDGSLAGSLELSATLGAGNDVFALSGGEVVSSGDLTVEVGAGDGHDAVSVTLLEEISGTVDFDVTLGAGNDQATAVLGDLAGSADVTMDVEGGTGDDRFRLALNGDIGPDVTATFNVTLGEGRDTVIATAEGVVDDAASVSVTVIGSTALDRSIIRLGEATSAIDLIFSAVEPGIALL